MSDLIKEIAAKRLSQYLDERKKYLMGRDRQSR